MAVTLEIVGGWDRRELLLRLLSVIGSPWQPGPKGLHERGTKAVCAVTMRGRDAALPAKIREGESRVAPSIPDDDWPDIDDHHAVLTVRATSTTPLTAAADLLRCGAALVNAGGAAVRCVESGASHSGTRWVELAQAWAEADVAERWPTLIAAWARYPVPADLPGAGWTTRGLAALGYVDVEVEGPVDETLAHDVCEAVLVRQLANRDGTGRVTVHQRRFDVVRAGAALRARRLPPAER